MPDHERSPQLDADLTRAVGELLAEGGYAAATVDAVAHRSGVDAGYLRRRWNSPAEMVFALAVHREQIHDPDTGSLAGDLLELAHRIVTAMARPAARTAVPGVLATMLADPQLAARFRDGFMAAERRAVEALLHAAALRGEITRPVDAAAVHAHLLGSVFARVVLFGAPPPPDLAADLAADVLLLVTGPAADAATSTLT